MSFITVFVGNETAFYCMRLRFYYIQGIYSITCNNLNPCNLKLKLLMYNKIIQNFKHLGEFLIPNNNEKAVNQGRERKMGTVPGNIKVQILILSNQIQ